MMICPTCKKQEGLIAELREKLAASEAAETAAHVKRVNEYAHAERLIAWLGDPERQPAHLAFTAGTERQVAYAVEALLRPLPCGHHAAKQGDEGTAYCEACEARAIIDSAPANMCRMDHPEVRHDTELCPACELEAMAKERDAVLSMLGRVVEKATAAGKHLAEWLEAQDSDQWDAHNELQAVLIEARAFRSSKPGAA